MNLEPEGAAARCRQAAANLEADRAVARIWSGDGSFWRAEAVGSEDAAVVVALLDLFEAKPAPTATRAA